MHNKPPQKHIDQQIVKKRGALANDTPGGESLDSKNDHLKSPPYSVPKGIRVHDEGPDTWGVGQGGKK